MFLFCATARLESHKKYYKNLSKQQTHKKRLPFLFLQKSFLKLVYSRDADVDDDDDAASAVGLSHDHAAYLLRSLDYLFLIHFFFFFKFISPHIA